MVIVHIEKILQNPFSRGYWQIFSSPQRLTCIRTKPFLRSILDQIQDEIRPKYEQMLAQNPDQKEKLINQFHEEIEVRLKEWKRNEKRLKNKWKKD